MRWLWVIAFIGCGNDKNPEPPPAKPPPPPVVVPDASTAPVRVEIDRNTGESWFVQSISSDRKRVLLRQMNRGTFHYRVVSIPGNQLEADVDLPAVAALPENTVDDNGTVIGNKLDLSAPALGDELRKIGPVLALFPLGAGDRIAASPDGKHVAFNAGDWLYTAVDGKIITRVAEQASYDPWFTPDGKALLFRRISGTVNGFEGRYELYATSVDGKQPPRKLTGATALRDFFGVTEQGAIRAISSAEPEIPTCVVEIAVTAPYSVNRLACLPKREDASACVMSLRGSWAACECAETLPELDPNSTRHLPDGGVVHDHKRVMHTRTLEVATGKVTTPEDVPGLISGISDDGVLVVNASDGKLVLFDKAGTKRTIAPTPRPSLFTFFLAPDRLLTEAGGILTVLDVH